MTIPNPLEPEPPLFGGALDFLFAPQRGKKVKRASQVTRRTREREISAYQQAFPSATRQQAARRTAELRRRGYTPRTVRAQQATAEQQARAQAYRERSQRAQRPGGRGGIPIGRDTSPQRAYEALFNKIGPGAEAAGIMQRTVIPIPPGYQPVQNPPPELTTPEGTTVYYNPQTGTYLRSSPTAEPFFSNWNRQVVMANVQAMTDAERYWTIYEADAEAIRMRARIAQKGDTYSARYPRYALWFYHADYWQGATAA